MIERWLAAVEQGTRSQWQLGHEIALCGRLVKGYGSTNERGKDNLLHVLDHLAAGGQCAAAASPRRRDPRGAVGGAGRRRRQGTRQALVKHGARRCPVKAQPIMWVKKRRSTTA